MYKTPGSIFEYRSVVDDEKTALIFDDIPFSCAECNRWIDTAARLLLSCGVEKGSGFIVFDRNHPFFLSLLIGASKIGAKPICFDPQKIRLDELLQKVECKAVFYGDEFAFRVKNIPERIKKIKIEDLAEELCDFESDDYIIKDMSDPEDPYIQFMQKTESGEIITIETTPGQMIDCASNSAMKLKIEEDRQVVLVLDPLFDIRGIHFCFAGFCRGCTVILGGEKTKERLVSTIEDYNVTHLFLSAESLQAILPDPEEWRSPALHALQIHLTTEVKHLDFLRSFLEMVDCDITVALVLPESSGLLTLLPADELREALRSDDETLFFRAGSVGRTIPEMEIKLSGDPGRNGNKASSGRITIRGPFTASRNGGESEGSGEWLITDRTGMIDPDGYLSLHS